MARMNRAGLAVLVLLGAGLAYAAPALHQVLAIFKGGIQIGSSGAALSDSYAGSATVNFGDIAAGDCEESSGVTATGVAVGDPCIAAGPAAADAGTAFSVSCRASATNEVKFKGCAEANTNLPSSTYYFRTFDP